MKKQKSSGIDAFLEKKILDACSVYGGGGPTKDLIKPVTTSIASPCCSTCDCVDNEDTAAD